MGSSPGRMIAIRQLIRPPTMKPLWSEGISPERTSDDLPLPDVPTTASKRVVRSAAAVRRSRLRGRRTSVLRPARRGGARETD